MPCVFRVWRPRNQENEEGQGNSENLRARAIMPKQMQQPAPGKQTKPGYIHEDHHGASNRKGCDVASNPFGSLQHGDGRASQHRGGNIVERGASADQQDGVAVGSVKGGPAPDDIRTQRCEDLSHEGRVGTKQFRSKQLKENRPPDLMRRNSQQHAPCRAQISITSIGEQQVPRGDGGQQTYPKSVGQEAREQDRDADCQCQKTVETICATRSIASIQARDNYVASEPVDDILCCQAGGERLVGSDIQELKCLIGKQADDHPKQQFATANVRYYAA
jgi:hypothetical protein